MLKQLNKRYFAGHQQKEFSVARFQYSRYFMPEVEELANKILVPTACDRQDAMMIDAAVTPEELLKCMRKELSSSNQQKLRMIILERETEIKPLIQRRMITNRQDIFIEYVLHFFLHCEENCCEWIMQHYDTIHSEYLKSMLCLVLGLRGDISSIPLLMKEVDRFEQWYPDESHEQGPLLALYELKDRFRLIKT